LLGLALGAIVGIIIVMYKKRKILKNGLGVSYQYLQHNPHLLQSLKDLPTSTKSHPSFVHIVHEFDYIIHDLMQAKDPETRIQEVERLLPISEYPRLCQLTADFRQFNNNNNINGNN